MLRYYPSFRVKTNLTTMGSEYRTSNGPYKGKYYLTYDGKAFTGPNPIVGPNQQLFKIQSNVLQDFASDLSLNKNAVGINLNNLPANTKKDILQKLSANRGAPVSYFPIPTESDYKKGYLIRYFIKKVNDSGLVIEISPVEYDNFQNGTVDYDVSYYQTAKILWKITGPLNSIRVNQYDTRSGIIDTNTRLVEETEKEFLGIKDFIGGNYTKFAKPTP
jgi:hypothetical protein